MIMISTCVPIVMRSGNTKNAAMARSQGSASGQMKWCRCSRNSAARWRAASLAVGISLAAIETRRLEQENDRSDRIDQEVARLREHVFAAGVDDADHQRRQQRALETAEAADGDYDEEQHQIQDCEIRRQAEQLDGEPAAKRGKPGAQREGEREQPVDIDADRLGHAPVVDRGADLGADIGALKSVPED